MRSINCNPLSKLKQDIIVPLLESIFVPGVSNIIWVYYCISTNNVLYNYCRIRPKMNFDDTNARWTLYKNPLAKLNFNVNKYYKFIIAGGYALQTVMKLSLETDIDVFLVCTDNKASVENKQIAREHAINYFIQYLHKNIPIPVNMDAKKNILKVTIQPHVLTFYNSRILPIQLITSEYNSIKEIFKFFDITICKCAYDGDQFIIDDDALHDLKCDPPQMTVLRKSPSMPYRILKYMRRGFALNIDEHILNNFSNTYKYLKILGIDKYINGINQKNNIFFCDIQDNINLENKSSYDHNKYQYDVLSANIRMFIRGDVTKYIETIDINDTSINNYQLLFHKNLPELKYQITGDGTLNPIINEYYNKFQQMYRKCNIHNMHNIFPEKMRIKYLNLLLQNIPHDKIDAEMYSDFRHFISVQLTDLQYKPPTFEQPQREDNILYEQI